MVDEAEGDGDGDRVEGVGCPERVTGALADCLADCGGLVVSAGATWGTGPGGGFAA